MGSTEKETLKKVAVGCQGGGMHAAFTVGVLTEILNGVAEKKFELVGLSGTSAGALCTLMAWYGLAPKKSGPGSSQQAIDALNTTWDAFTAETTTETVLNQLSYYAFRLQETEAPVLGLSAPGFGINPASIVSKTITSWLPNLDVRKQYFDLMDFLHTACPKFTDIDWPRVKTRLLVGATEILQGCETVFDSNVNLKAPPPGSNPWRKRMPLSLEGVAASGTLPEFSETMQVGGGYYWDGLYSQNPPVRQLFSEVPKADTPDELWIVRINPQQWPPPAPTSRGDIIDRKNEMAGNLSLNKELDFLLTVNDMIATYGLPVAKDYKPVTVRTIKMTQTTADGLRYSSKFDRSRAFTDQLRNEGILVGRDWLNRWPNNVGSWPTDAAYP
jgi:NTE family protein